MVKRFYALIATHKDLGDLESKALQCDKHAVGLTKSGKLYKYNSRIKEATEISEEEAANILECSIEDVKKIKESKARFVFSEPVDEVKIVHPVIEETLDEEETQNPVIEKEDAEDEEDDEVEDEDPTSDIDDLIESVEDASADVQDALDKNADKITDLLTRIANALEDINKKLLD
jgi:hypothetical protein